MSDFVLATIIVVVALAVGFAVIAYSRGGLLGMSEAEPDGYPARLPVDTPLGSADVAALTFPMVLRGYQMAPVDEALRRLGEELDASRERIAELEAQLADSAGDGGSFTAWQA